MPTRKIQRSSAFGVQRLYTDFLSSLPGWGGGSADDIATMDWDGDPLVRALKITRVREAGLVRSVTYTAAELYTLVNGTPGWGSGTAADIAKVEADSAGRKLIIYKVEEAG